MPFFLTMQMSMKYTQILIATGVVAVVVCWWWPVRDTGDVLASAESALARDVGEVLSHVEAVENAAAIVPPALAIAHVPEASTDEGAEALMHLIPDWLLECGDVRRERVLVAGQEVERVRCRYTWPNGSCVEVEVSDCGADATEEQFLAMGFDLALEALETDQQLRLHEDGDSYLANLEYSVEDEAGHVQYVIAGRYLLEVQIEGLPLEAFDELEEQEGLFDVLYREALK
jgi:hypothetical protein